MLKSQCFWKNMYLGSNYHYLKFLLIRHDFISIYLHILDIFQVKCDFTKDFLPMYQYHFFSVFPPMSLLKFMQQGRIDKRAQIRELAHVVAGIRIFNWVI